MTKNTLKRFFALILSAVMVLGLLPLSAMAGQVSNGSGTWISGKLTYTFVAESEGSSSNGASGSVSVSGSTLTVKAVSSKATSGCSSESAYPTTTTVTVANASSYPLLVNSLTSNGATVSGVSSGATIPNGGNFTISITANPNSAEDTSSRTATGTVTISVTEQTSATITLSASPYVSYTVSGHTVQQNGSDVSFTANIGSTISLPSITAPEGYQFKGWRIGSNPITTASSFTVQNSCTVFPVIVSGSVQDADNFKVGSTYYTYWDEAVGAAASGNNKKVIVNLDVTLPSNMEDNLLTASGGTYVKPVSGGGIEYIIPSGVTVLVPFDAAGTAYTSTPSIVYGSHTTPTAFRTLTLPTGANITVQSGGVLNLSGQLSSSGQMGGWNGTPTGPDGRINMLGGSSITLKNGSALYCWGYIYGDGSVTAESGSTVYEAFQIKDWRGGTATSNVYKYAFIFNQYYIQNIEVPMTVYAGATENLYSSVNASSSAYPMNASFIGPSGLFNITSGYIIKDYIETTDRLHVEVNGDVSVSPMTLSGLPMIGSISTSDYILPITSNLSIDFVSGTSTVTQNIELLPGVEINIGRNATFTINNGKKVYVYDNDDWLNFSGSTRMYPIGYSVANGTTAIRSASSLKDVVLDVNGTLNVAGSLFTSNGGADITSALGTSGTSGRIVFSTAPTASSTIYEMLNNSDKTAVTFTAPVLHNGDDSYSATSGTGTSTWYYDKNGEHWYRYLVSFVYNGKTVATDYFCENNASIVYDASWLTGLGASVTSGSASASVSGTNVNVTNVSSNAVVTLTGTAASFIPTFVLNEKQYQNYQRFTGNTITDTRMINDETYYVVLSAPSAMQVGTNYAAPSDASMGVSSANHNSIAWNLSGVSASSGDPYNGFVPVGATPNGEVYVYGFYMGAVAYNSFTGGYYSTLAEAMAAVPSSGAGTVRLIADCGSFEEESGAAAYAVPSAVTLTVELDGFRAIGRIINKGDLTLDLKGGSWDYVTGATEASASYQAMSAVTNDAGTLTVTDSVGGGRITADAVSNAGVPNHASVVRNTNGGSAHISGVTLENVEDVNGYVSVILNDRSSITSVTDTTIISPRGYAIFNYGGHIGTIDSCTIDCAYGIYNRNVRGSNTIGNGYNIANYGTIGVIRDSSVTVGQYAVHNNAVITELNNCTFTAHPDSAQVNTYGTTAVNVQGNVQCYTVYNNNGWWYDSAVWKRTDTTSSPFTRTDDYKEDEAFRPTIGTITDCRIYAENTSTSADHGYALYNNGGIIGTIDGTTEIKTYKHPNNPKSIASNYALRNTAGGIIRSIEGSVTISASGYSALYNDGQFTLRTVSRCSDKIGGIQLSGSNTYGQPSEITSITASGTISAGSYYGLFNSGHIGSINGDLTVSANYNALLNSGAGSVSTYDIARTYTTNTDSSAETRRFETYVRNLEKGGVIESISGLHFVGTGSNSYYLLQNQGRIGSLKNSDFSASSPRAGESYAMFMNGDSRQSGYTLTREPFAYGSFYITPYAYHYDYSVAEIGEIDNVTITKNASYAFRNLGRINTLKNSSITGTQYVFLNTASGPYVSRDYVRYYSGTTKFATTKNNGSDLITSYQRTAATIGLIDNCTITASSTYALYNGGHIGAITGNTLSSTSTTVLYNGGAAIESFTSNILDIVEVTATDSACTVVYGNEAKVNITDYAAPVIDLIGAGNHISGTYQVLVNLGEITAIDGGSDPVTIASTTQKQVGGIYNYAGTLRHRIATTPYTDGTAGTAVNEDTYYSAHVSSIKNTLITANGIGIQNGSANTSYLPVIDELGDGLEVSANCTTAGYHAVFNTAYAKITSITGGIYTASKATTNAYKNNSTDPELATLISGGDFKGAASTRANAIYEPDNTNRQTYPEGMSLLTVPHSATLHDGTVAGDYYYVGVPAATYTITWKNWDGTTLLTTEVSEGDTPVYTGTTPTKPADAQYTYTFSGWDPAIVPASADATYTAQFTATLNTYTVTWKNWDGTVLKTDENVLYGTVPAYSGPTPTRPADAQYTYMFDHWDPAVTAVTGDAVYTAVFTQAANTYIVTWNNDDGTQLEVDSDVPYGAEPSYDGATPTKPSTAQFDYTFAGWTPELAPVTGNVTYTATYESVLRKYEIRFVNYNGEELQSSEVDYGATPAYNGQTPAKPSTAQFDYTFAGWDPEITAVDGPATYTAQFTESVRSYTVIWKNWDGNVLDTEYYEYGTTPSYKGQTPERTGDAQYSYSFSGWDPAITEVTGDAAYTAQFDTAVNYYSVTWVIDGESQTEQYPYGATPTHADPEKTGHTFTGWSPAIAEVTGDATYTAQFSVNSYTVTFLINGEFYAEASFPYGAAVEAPEYEAPAGYVFSGWTLPDSMPDHALTLDSTLAPNPRTLTIEYRFVDDTAAADTYTATVAYTESYSVTSPDVLGCIPDIAQVSGVMPDEDLVIRVVYNRIGDTDQNNAVTPSDVSLLSAYLLNMGPLSGQAYTNADANLDGNVDVLDLAAICAIANGGAH